jgi:hypothetical protein
LEPRSKISAFTATLQHTLDAAGPRGFSKETRIAAAVIIFLTMTAAHGESWRVKRLPVANRGLSGRV